MSEFLFIRPSMLDPRSYLWFAYDSNSKNILASGESSGLKELAQVNENSPDRPVVVLYPSSSLKFKHILFPGKLKKHAYEPVLYMLEDEFAENVDDFYAHLLNKQGKEYDFLICKKGEIEELEDVLTTMGFIVYGICPDVLAVPAPEMDGETKVIKAIKIGNDWLIRNSAYGGVSIQEDWLPEFQASLGEGIRVDALSSIPDNMELPWHVALVASPMALLADGALKTRFNISRAEKKRNIQFRFLASWMKVVAMALLFAVLWNLNMGSRIKAVNDETMEYRNQQRSLFSQLAQNKGRVNDPVSKMKEILANQSPIGTDEGYIDLIKLISPVITNAKGVELVSLQFNRENRLFTIQFLSDSDINVNNFIKKFSPNFSATLKDAKPSRNRILNSVDLRRMK